MKKRPWTFTLMSVIFLGMVLSFPLQIAYLYGHGPLEVDAIFNKITFFNWVCMGSLLLLSDLARNGSRGIYFAIPLTLSLICWNNYLVGHWGYDYNLTTTTLSSLAFGFLCLFPFLPSYARVIQNPSLRWWMIATRKEIMIPASVSHTRGRHFQTKTVDISQTGAFLESPCENLKLGEVVDLNLKINTLQNLHLKAEVVRMQQENQGFGVRFQELEVRQKRMLHRYLQSH